mgnify:CR=1 FL=1
MERKEIKNRIIALAYEALGTEIAETESLKESGVDSLSLVAVAVGIEEDFGFTFCEDDLQPEKLQTLSDLVAITEKYV